MKIYLIILLLVCALSCGDAGDAATSTDQENIQGAWLGQTESLNGIQKDVSFLYVFKGDTVSFTDETGKEMRYSFKLDTTGNPRLLIIRSEDTLTNPTPVSVGYELNGDSLKIVVAPPGLRPTEISDKNDQELIICKRKGSGKT
ncbi:hypothetical protein [Chitinophaga sp. S165]|uniref:hypothetical protein n=1 Tax=Chitinophaga sp. S165 TaxID=2135462 RepID=UPI000D719066|nr:hypothetical protein [Chitinophaga sp. S165]PWV55576.1 uncharacterized protein (TIGR03067 family) [Chitinophaga sp. S165]